jgi:uncharacterized protein YkwD
MLRTIAIIVALLVGSTPPTASILDRPPTYLTRAEATMLLLSSADIPLLLDDQPLLFPDVLEGEWYIAYLKTALRMKIVEPDASNGLLHPHGSVSRGEFLKMLTITFSLETNIPFPFTDVPANTPYRTFVGIAQKTGIFRDKNSPLLLHPDARVTQDEAVDAIAKILKANFQGKSVSTTLMKKDLKRAEQSQPPTPILSPAQNLSPAQPPSVSPPQRSAYALRPATVKESLRMNLAKRSNTLDAVRLEILQRVNAERRNAGLHILRHNTLLADAAQLHAKDMHKRGYFSHFTPEGLSYVDRIRDAGYLDKNAALCPCTTTVNTMDLLQNRREIGPDYIMIKSGDQCACLAKFALGENIAKGQLTPTQVMNDWMKSENHRKNILSGAFDEIGIGIFGDLWAQEFGKIED